MASGQTRGWGQTLGPPFSGLQSMKHAPTLLVGRASHSASVQGCAPAHCRQSRVQLPLLVTLCALGCTSRCSSGPYTFGRLNLPCSSESDCMPPSHCVQWEPSSHLRCSARARSAIRSPCPY
jgi:hypothetical protein